MAHVVSTLWFEKEVTEAVEFYISIIPNSRIIRKTTMPTETPSGPPGSVIIVELSLGGQNFSAFEARRPEAFNYSFSIAVQCESQAEIDRIWNAFLENGGSPQQCGWLKDRWGLSWQIAPRSLGDMVANPDREAAKRATEAMLQMVKLDIAELERAFRG
ncbi:VOC family protein [Rhizobium sp. LC145]|uniref:VOC family protein n=1 Tax=Rhizobium sp. LC145 TaxID=1120688 RepID=UPI000629F969|nr:VOC family protein [Rhizobium sp. LC145]KKX28073.1 3-demethylubiquinone-9 3-methyltransferase [Rhizobium sp. LC145]TKT43336.1 VOC family protein [Rhizobiaceae bacterium LC148]